MLTRALEGEGISEGEKDTDRLVSLGLRATSSPNGAKAWKDEYADQVKAAGVSEMILWPHQDAEGARYTADVAASYLRRKIRVKVVALPGLPEHGDISDWLDLGHPLEELLALVDATPWLVERPADTDPGDRDYLEPLAAFLAEEDPPLEVIFPTILPRGTLMLLHGDARARKSLAAFEFALSAATGTAPFGLARFRPDTPVPVLYIQEEDSRSLTRPRLRRLVRERCGRNVPDALCVSVRRGVDLDDPVWVARLIADLQRLNIRLLVLDAARRLSIKTDEGPAKVRELTAVLRTIVTTAGVAIIIVHHDVKPIRDGQDQRRRSHRASGGDWFAACECPIHVEKIDDHESLVFPQDYKFSLDPDPFTFRCVLDDRLIKSLVGKDTTSHLAESVGARGKLISWLSVHGPASKTAMRKAGLGTWQTIDANVDALVRDNLLDSGPGRKAGTHLYFVIGVNRLPTEDGSLAETVR